MIFSEKQTVIKNSYYTKESNYADLETLPNIDIDADLKEILRQSDISIPEYKQAVADYKTAPNKEKKKEIFRIISAIKSTLKTEVDKKDRKRKLLSDKRGKIANLESPELFELSAKEIKARKKAEGVILGRPKGSKSKIYKLTGKEEEIKVLLDKKISKSAIARIMGVHRLTVADFIKAQDFS